MGWVVLVGGAGVQGGVVGDELDVARLQLHVEVQGGLVGDRLVEIEQLAFRGREARGVRVSLHGAEIVAVVEGA